MVSAQFSERSAKIARLVGRLGSGLELELLPVFKMNLQTSEPSDTDYNINKHNIA